LRQLEYFYSKKTCNLVVKINNQTAKFLGEKIGSPVWRFLELIFRTQFKQYIISIKIYCQVNNIVKVYMISSLHIKLARTALGLTQEELAKKSGVSSPTIKNIELTNPNEELGNNRSTIIALVKFFEDNEVEFIDEKDSVGVRVGKKTIKQRYK